MQATNSNVALVQRRSFRHTHSFDPWDDPLEKEMAIHSSILAWRIPWTEEPGGLHTVHGVAKSHSCLAWRAIPSPLSKLKRRVDSL